MLLAGLLAQRGLAPGSQRAGMADRGLALTTAVRVVAGVHNRTADGRPPAHVAFPAGLADGDVLVVDVADLADGRLALRGEVAQLAGGEADQSVFALFRHQLRHVAGGADELGALFGVDLDVVDEGTDRDAGHRQGVAGLDIPSSPLLTVSPTLRPLAARM